jgi:hypothetical protein
VGFIFDFPRAPLPQAAPHNAILPNSRMADANPTSPSGLAWSMALAGLGLFIFALVALSGPGRIDIVDGQARFEVGRSLAEHGDSVLRDDRIWFGSFPGRDGRPYTTYRLPQSLVALAAIAVADATGPVDEGRRHFFFVLGGAVACALLSILYALWFRKMGLRPGASLFWACCGIVCTPMWFYGTSTFDEYLGTTVLIAALVAARLGRGRWSGAIGAGLLLGLAFNVKQPLSCFTLLALALHDEAKLPHRKRLLFACIIVAGVVGGACAEHAYDDFKFPFDKETVHADLLKLYGPTFANHQLEAIAVLSASSGAGAVWYFPPIILCVVGIAQRWKTEPYVVGALILSSLPLLAFLCFLSYFKGDVCWGPRYLTPLFGIMWAFAPWATQRMRPTLVAIILVLGLVVQMLALSVDMHRLYVQRDASSGFGRVHPWLYFDRRLSHLWNRPHEIIEIARDDRPAAAYTPAPAPTFTFPVIDPPSMKERGPEVVERYRVLNSFRPWWASMDYLSPKQRPVDLAHTAALLLALAFGGCGLVLGAMFWPGRRSTLALDMSGDLATKSAVG